MNSLDGAIRKLKKLGLSYTDKINVSKLPTAKTAHTVKTCAEQRAENLAILGAKKVLELCAGPSLKDLADAYDKHNIACLGNDIDSRWQREFPDYKWLIGDAITTFEHYVESSSIDTFVFAPPLSRGCTGKREDALPIDWVKPSYLDFIAAMERHPRMRARAVLVLPARCFASAWDRQQYYKLLAKIKRPYEVCSLTNKVRKYVDVYISGYVNEPKPAPVVKRHKHGAHFWSFGAAAPVGTVGVAENF